MSAFKEQLQNDLTDIWFSELEEFWENIRIKTGVTTKTIKGIFDSDELIRKTVKKVYQETTKNIANDKKLLMCLESELTPPTINTKIVINNTTYTVIDVDNQMGLLVIQLERVTQGASGGKV